MNTKRELIEYSGIDTCPIKPKTMFNQINLENISVIPAQKPDIEEIDKVWVKGEVTDYEIVKTPVGTSLEGQNLTGYKILVCGNIQIKVQYTANEPTQSIHIAEIIYPFCSYGVLEPDINLNMKIYPSILVEDIFAELTNKRCIYTNTTVAVVTDIY
ncbi:MAG: hypothetical protein ACRCTZ_02730 [Sarcina sp.]